MSDEITRNKKATEIDGTHMVAQYQPKILSPNMKQCAIRILHRIHKYDANLTYTKYPSNHEKNCRENAWSDIFRRFHLLTAF